MAHETRWLHSTFRAAFINSCQLLVNFVMHITNIVIFVSDGIEIALRKIIESDRVKNLTKCLQLQTKKQNNNVLCDIYQHSDIMFTLIVVINMIMQINNIVIFVLDGNEIALWKIVEFDRVKSLINSFHLQRKSKIITSRWPHSACRARFIKILMPCVHIFYSWISSYI